MDVKALDDAVSDISLSFESTSYMPRTKSTTADGFESSCRLPAEERMFDEASSTTATTTTTTSSTAAPTPPTTASTNPSDMTTIPNFWDGNSRGAVPWPGNTYQIVEKHSGHFLTLTSVGDVSLRPSAALDNESTHWLCVEKDGYFGFHSPNAGTYLGHDGNHGVRATARELNDWELLTPREHPDGGYQILFPFYWHTLKLLCLAEDGQRLVRRRHGTTLWEFVRV